MGLGCPIFNLFLDRCLGWLEFHVCLSPLLVAAALAHIMSAGTPMSFPEGSKDPCPSPPADLTGWAYGAFYPEWPTVKG